MNAMVNIEEKCANICLFYLYFLSLRLTKPVHSGQGGSRHRGKEADAVCRARLGKDVFGRYYLRSSNFATLNFSQI